jgi:lipoprotein-anchoring transpeptidase ErfK/SrfK
MVVRAWFCWMRRRTPGPIVLAATAVLVTAGTGSLAPTQAVPELLAASAPTGHSGSSTPCSASAKACLDLSKHQAWLTDGAGHITFGPVPARGGSKSAKTPKGTFSVLSKDANFYSTEFHAPMPYSVFFYPGDAFHADSTSVASNGCIHLTSSSAQRFYNTLHLGDRVQVVG